MRFDASGEVWAELDSLLRQRWPSKLGGSLKLDATCVDAGDGDHFDSVLAFCTPRMSRRVFATKGAAGPGRPIIMRSRGKKPLFIVGADTAKGQILSRLSRGRTIRFSQILDENYYLQLCSERRIVRMSRGRPVVRFERLPGFRAEALDCLALALAGRASSSRFNLLDDGLGAQSANTGLMRFQPRKQSSRVHEKRRLADFRRSGANEAIAGDATPAALSHAMGSTLATSNALFATYCPVNLTTIRSVMDARRRGRTKLRGNG